MSRRSARGFTLIEIIAAISILGLAISGAVALLDEINDGSRRIVREGGRVARESNGARLLRRLLVDAKASTDSTRRFRGDENTLELWTLCDVPGGWAEDCRVSLSIDQRGDSSVVVADVPGSGVFSARRQAGPVSFRYYHPSARTDTVWARQWSSNVSLPAAIGLVVGSDTIVLPVGPARE
jgi:prepilin-type N-terminal cleavage/methylation domain-containing protein